ncbi:MAG: hypothetical protein A3K19_19550 [Lentisphaerae bacterium RIFOXYB12_FULL_65_16]|nr:MAG: hypothetical protein A3K18_31265 [Lentisphaerae bacterium RIFOXYA12_64_32]OGV92058.1 MAG: hypothetical protein A3K19_19550 [Lentisphaerae bacterium RIFOXYB12_FULL_65_16]
MHQIVSKWLILVLISGALTASAQEATSFKVRVKDVARIQGNENQTLIGYGLIIGLAGSGDSDEELTQRTIANLLQNFNITVDKNNLKAKNTAVVMVTVNIASPAHKHDMLPATVASIGDAASLTGGELLLTPLLGTDGTVWALAQGPVMTGSYSFGSSAAGGETVSKNHPTTGRLTNGVKLLRDVGLDATDADVLTLCLSNPDFTSAANLADALNSRFPGAALASDSATVRVRVAKEYLDGRTLEFIREIEAVEFAPDQKAKIVFNERTGTIIFGGSVRISSVAITHGTLTVTIKNTETVSQPGPLSRQATTERIRDQQTSAQEDRPPVIMLPDVTTVSELVKVLNALGVTPRDIMVIMHALKEAGALHAELVSL